MSLYTMCPECGNENRASDLYCITCGPNLTACAPTKLCCVCGNDHQNDSISCTTCAIEIDYRLQTAERNLNKCDNWVIVKSPPLPDPHYRVLVGTSGGYLDGDSWRMNSGIVRVDESAEFFYIYGASGSCYQCNKKAYMVRMNSAYILDQLKNRGWELMPEDTDWNNMDWIIK